MIFCMLFRIFSRRLKVYIKEVGFIETFLFNINVEILRSSGWLWATLEVNCEVRNKLSGLLHWYFDRLGFWFSGTVALRFWKALSLDFEGEKDKWGNWLRLRLREIEGRGEVTKWGKSLELLGDLRTDLLLNGNRVGVKWNHNWFYFLEYLRENKKKKIFTKNWSFSSKYFFSLVLISWD